jgi:hypothetical protein
MLQRVTFVACARQTKIGNVLGFVSTLRQVTRKRRRQLRVDEKPHDYIFLRMILSENRLPLCGTMRYAGRIIG